MGHISKTGSNSYELDEVSNLYGEGGYYAQRRKRYSDSNLGNRFNNLLMLLAIGDAITAIGCPPKNILEIGCGDGLKLREIVSKIPGVSVVGVDIDPKRASESQKNLPEAKIITGDFITMPRDILCKAGQGLDLIIALTVLSSLNPAAQKAVSEKAVELLEPNKGTIIIVDVRYPNPQNSKLHAIPHSRLKELFPDMRLHVEPIMLIPQLARRITSRKFFDMLYRLPVLRSHNIAVISN